eukprot:scpid96789/ scgid31264/ 
MRCSNLNQPAPSKLAIYPGLSRTSEYYRHSSPLPTLVPAFRYIVFRSASCQPQHFGKYARCFSVSCIQDEQQRQQQDSKLCKKCSSWPLRAQAMAGTFIGAVTKLLFARIMFISCMLGIPLRNNCIDKHSAANNAVPANVGHTLIQNHLRSTESVAQYRDGMRCKAARCRSDFPTEIIEHVHAMSMSNLNDKKGTRRVET